MKSFAKINIFLKVIGKLGNYHEIASRFILFEELFDTIKFKEEPSKNFTIATNKTIPGENLIKKAYDILAKEFSCVEPFFKSHTVELNKQIPIGGGLGGGSSNCATFLKLCNETLGLKMSKKELIELSLPLGCDIAFFISEQRAANVYGKGEIIEPFVDDIPNLKLFCLPICSNTAAVYGEFRNSFFKDIDPNLAKKFSTLTTKELLKNYKNRQLNDLLAPFVKIYSITLNDNEFLSGSGSSYYKVMDEDNSKK